MSRHRNVVTEVVALVEERGRPLTVRELSEALGVPGEEIRRQVRADDAPGGADREALCDTREVLPSPGDHEGGVPDADDNVVWLSGLPGRDLLGTQRFDSATLGPLYRAASDLAAVEPDNLILAEAGEKLRAGFLPGLRPPSELRAELLGALGRAMTAGRRVRIRYARAWEPGVFERVVDPYRIEWTRRGPELDAGPVRNDGSVRIYPISRIESAEVLDSTFERPAGVEELSAAARSTTTVAGRVPASRLWVVEQAAEVTRELGREGEWVRFEADLLPPVAWRAARMIVVAGAGAELDDPALDAAVVEAAQRVRSHHGLDGALV